MQAIHYLRCATKEQITEKKGYDPMKNTIAYLTIETKGSIIPPEPMPETEALELMNDLGFAAFKTVVRDSIRNVWYKNDKYPETFCRIGYQH